MIILLKYFIAGFIVNLITGFDDMLTEVPILSYITKRRKEKIAFGIGVFIAISLAVTLALFFSELIKRIPGYKYFVTGIIFLLAILIYFDILPKRRKNKSKKKIRKLKKLSHKRVLYLFLIGFVMTFATILDDIIAFSSLFLSGQLIAVLLGIFTAALLEVFALIYLSKQLDQLKFKKEIVVMGLILLGILLLTGVI